MFEPVASASRLFGEGLQHWLTHQGDFWKWAGPIALMFAAFRFASGMGWTKPSDLAGLALVLDVIVLNYWFKNSLYDDWKRRARLLSRDRRSRRFTAAGLAFAAFCAAYAIAIFIPSLLILIGIGPSGRGQEGLFLLTAFMTQSILMIVMAVAFGNLLLFLPARAAGLQWKLSDAFRAAQGIRGQLIAIALLCTVMSIVGALTVVGAGFLRLPDGPWLAAIAHGLVVVADFVALYALAYCLSRLFVAKTGWRPEPLPEREPPAVTT